jgi:hypothetical protein
MLFSYGSGQQRIDGNKKCRRVDGNFDCHDNAAVRRGAHRLMEHILDFTRSHWMPPSCKCLCHIPPVAVTVNGFVETTQNKLLDSNYGTFQALVVSENFIPQNGPSTQVIDVTSFV